MFGSPHLGRIAIAVAVGGLVGALTMLGGSAPTPAASRGDCFTGLRLLRHAIASFEAQHGRLPGADGPAPTSQQLVSQLTQPRDVRGTPSQQGPFPGIIDSIPLNPFTGSREIAVVPEGTDATAFAAASRAGWAYLVLPGKDADGPLPAGLVLPCGHDPVAGHATVQNLAFEVEDFQRWR